MYFLHKNLHKMYFDSNLPDFFPKGLIDIESIFVLVMAGQQTITWTNDDPVHWQAYTIDTQYIGTI